MKNSPLVPNRLDISNIKKEISGVQKLIALYQNSKTTKNKKSGQNG
jgi:hypothetical protein